MGKELSLYDIDKAFGEILEEFPDRRRTLVNDAGEKMYQGVMRNIDSNINEGSGTLKRGVEKKIGSGGGYAAIRPNHAIAPHTHLVENGHNVKKVKSGAVIGWAQGKFMYRNALTSLESELRRDSKKALERLVRDTFG
ncbi:hypothetical protein DSECCO2_384790 [anaerobic digester metagenome]